MPDKKEEEKSFFKKHEFAFSLMLFIVFLALFILVSGHKINLTQTCGDGTPYNECSITKPYFCDGGFLIEKASACGCEGSSINGETCLLPYQTEPKNVILNYILDGKQQGLEFNIYGGLVDYLTHESRDISYQSGQTPARADFKLKILNNQLQREFLMPLVIAIQNQTKDKVEQARIATSIVQNIPYGFSNKTTTFYGQEINYSRYPYEILADNAGICGEKSELLAFLLRELGYKTAIFYNQKENHEYVGISCPREESYKGTGYCFIETTAPAIISDGSIEYVGGVVLDSDPEIISISNGTSLPRNLAEYRDAKIMKAIRENQPLLFREFEFNRLKEKYGLVEEYFSA